MTDDEFPWQIDDSVGGANALVVEDDPALAQVCVQELERLHVHAMVVGTKTEAMAILARRADPLAFAFVDPSIRDASDVDVAAEARRLRPTLPLVVASSDVADLLSVDGVVLCKPFTAEQFQAALDAALVGD